MRHCGLGRRWLFGLNAGKTRSTSLKTLTGAVDVKIDGSVLEKK